MKMTCICTDEVVSIVLIPPTEASADGNREALGSRGKIVFNVTTTTVLDDGTEVGSQSTPNTVDLPDTLLAQVLALNVAPVSV